ncbi:hypothetical protein G3M81_22870 [Bacillus paralicheniformis]|nr:MULTISPECIES: hypothetical protein [Bacillus]QII26936.1 hypothetical protein G3M80_20780 [Bacillus altitudinis]QII51404.1 hypothetical protein G3M81_22870 [Bacillus paralicheniformis]
MSIQPTIDYLNMMKQLQSQGQKDVCFLDPKREYHFDKWRKTKKST